MTALYETENSPVYLRKAEKIIDMLLEDETETDFIKSIREKIRKQAYKCAYRISDQSI